MTLSDTAAHGIRTTARETVLGTATWWGGDRLTALPTKEMTR